MVQLAVVQGVTDYKLHLVDPVSDIVLSQEGGPQYYQSVREISRNSSVINWSHHF